MRHTLERIVVVPRNGYANRLQAWASARILADDLGVPLSVRWEAEPIAAASAADLFSPDLVGREFWDRRQLDDLVGSPHEELPRYLTVLPERRLVVLAGHDRGEQVFMSALDEVLRGSYEPTSLLIIAGGKFHAGAGKDFVERRRAFYAGIPWSAQIEERFTRLSADHDTYAGLHIRGTDRSRAAPPSRLIDAALSRLRDRVPFDSLFIAADSASAGDRWSERASGLGFHPWNAGAVDHSRDRAQAGIDAMVDWRLLGSSATVIYSRESSFGEEAAVATGHVDSCIPLAASPALQRSRAARDLAAAAVTYPKRHGWLPAGRM